MTDNNILHPFAKSEQIYFRITLIMVLLSIVFLIIGYTVVKIIFPMPEPMIFLVMAYMYAHVIHFLYGIYRLFYFFIKVRKQKLGITITKTLISIVASPISAVIAYLALFLMILSSCGADG